MSGAKNNSPVAAAAAVNAASAPTARRSMSSEAAEIGTDMRITPIVGIETKRPIWLRLNPSRVAYTAPSPRNAPCVTPTMRQVSIPVGAWWNSSRQRHPLRLDDTGGRCVLRQSDGGDGERDQDRRDREPGDLVWVEPSEPELTDAVRDDGREVVQRQDPSPDLVGGELVQPRLGHDVLAGEAGAHREPQRHPHVLGRLSDRRR